MPPGVELRFGEGVVVADLERLSERVTPRSAGSFAVHLLAKGAPRSEGQGEDLGIDALLEAGLLDELSGQRRALPLGDHPPPRRTG